MPCLAPETFGHLKWEVIFIYLCKINTSCSTQIRLPQGIQLFVIKTSIWLFILNIYTLLYTLRIINNWRVYLETEIRVPLKFENVCTTTHWLLNLIGIDCSNPHTSLYYKSTAYYFFCICEKKLKAGFFVVNIAYVACHHLKLRRRFVCFVRKTSKQQNR